MTEAHSLRVEVATLAWLDALAVGDAEFATRFGIPVVSGWCDGSETIAFAQRLARAGVGEWGVHLFFDGSDGALVGNGGWKGPPHEGRAELGYAVAPQRRGRGIATAAVRELVARAARRDVAVVVAHTAPEASASTTVLTRCGFTKVAHVVDPDDGPMWRWERRVG